MDNKTITKSNIALVKELLDKVHNLSETEYKTFLNSASQFHKYSFSNQLILWSNNCSQVAGFKTWKALGRTVKAGSKAVWILAPNGLRTFKKEVKNTDGSITEKEYCINSFKSVPVFDISNTEGAPINNGMTTSTAVSYEVLKGVAEKLGYTVNLKPLEIELGGFISGNNITLNSNLSATENAGTLIHETMHGLLKHGDSKDIKSRDVKEQEAETGTYLLCQQLGVERKSEFYLKSWNITKEVMTSFKAINKAVKSFMENVTI